MLQQYDLSYLVTVKLAYEILLSNCMSFENNFPSYFYIILNELIIGMSASVGC